MIWPSSISVTWSGGHAPSVTNEKVFQFTFPERPGALIGFLMSLGSRWNISMFHYRNHGAAYSRVLMGAEVDDGDMPDFRAMLDNIGFEYMKRSRTTRPIGFFWESNRDPFSGNRALQNANISELL